MPATSRMLLASAIALASLTQSLHAQIAFPPLSRDCDYQLLIKAPAAGDVGGEWRASYPLHQIEALRPLARSGRWLAALDSVRASFDRTAGTLLPASVAFDERIDRFRNRFDSVRARIVEMSDAPTAAVLSAKQNALRGVGAGNFQTVMRNEQATLFAGTPQEFVVTSADTLNLRRTICYHAAAMRQLLDTLTQGARQMAAEVLTTKRARWDNYFSHGYSQLPWELYINSRNARSAKKLDPPTTQLILLHPSVAVQLSGSNFRDFVRHDAIALEPVGYIWYRNEYRSYFGLSAAVVFAADAGTGVAPFLHFGRVAKVGYVFSTRRNDKVGKRPDGLLMSIDLYKYLSDRSSQVDGVLQKAKAKLEKP